MREARFYTKLENQIVQCNLCPWNCVLNPGQKGVCKIRTNENGNLLTHVYNKIAAFGIDPIEKKPLYHFHPGRNILSIGEVGCNLHCTFCQNHRISQCYAEDFHEFREVTSEQIVKEALKTYRNVGIAYTYNEPCTFYEFLIDTALLAKKSQLKNVVVSNGYINPEPLKQLLPFIDAFNIDLKAFTSDFYKQQTKGDLKPVLEVLKIISESDSHLEITTLIIPDLNDDETDFEKMVLWISKELSNEIPLHLSRYFPQFQMKHPPTPVSKLELFFNIAKRHLKYVYLGNVSDTIHSSTFCSSCGQMQIARNRYRAQIEGIDEKGFCTNCKTYSGVIV